MATALFDRPETDSRVLTVPSPEELTATPAAFIEWLTQKNPDEIVGHACVSAICPLASWLSEVYGECYVNPPSYHIVGQPSRPCPSWMTEFVHRVDSLPGYYPVVTVEDAVLLLEGLR